jgi:hypothetical protein
MGFSVTWQALSKAVAIKAIISAEHLVLCLMMLPIFTRQTLMAFLYWFFIR